jgi:hypothetical protein
MKIFQNFINFSSIFLIIIIIMIINSIMGDEENDAKQVNKGRTHPN